MKQYKSFAFILVAAFFLFACQPQVVTEAVYVESASDQSNTNYNQNLLVGAVEVEQRVEVQATVVASDGLVAPAPQQSPQEQAQPSQPQERLIIRTGNLSMTVADTEQAIEEISNLVNGAGGWVVSSNSFQYGGGVRGSLTIRFPAESFNQMGTDIKSLAIEINNESSSGQDVTDEFVDLGARLKNLEATADRVRAFLDEADNVEEALAVNIELSRLEGEIEVIKGRMQYLSQSAAFSTLTIEIWPDEVAQPIDIDRWLPFEVAEEAVEALANTMQGLANFVIWLVIYIAPVGLVIGVPTFYIGRRAVRWFRARRGARATEVAEPAAE